MYLHFAFSCWFRAYILDRCIGYDSFGLGIGVLICFLGGLMAVDIAPRNASGAALGVVGIASYIGAGLQDVMSGILIEGQKRFRTE